MFDYSRLGHGMMGHHSADPSPIDEYQPEFYYKNLVSLPCEKNTGHLQFIPIKGLTTESLPEHVKNPHFLKWIHLLANITVKVNSTCLSARPKFRLRTGTEYPHSNEDSNSTIRNGTGTVVKVNLRDEGQGSRSFELKVITTRHHVWNKTELEGLTLDICFHDADGNTIFSKTLTANSQSEYSVINMDTCALFLTTDDDELGVPLGKFCDEFWEMACRLKEFCSSPEGHEILPLVSYPHGCQKYVSFGEVAKSLLYLTESATSAVYVLAVYLSHSLTDRTDKDMCSSYTTPTCVGCSGALGLSYCKSDDCLKLFIHEGYHIGDQLNHSGNPEFIRAECLGGSLEESSALQRRRIYSQRIDEEETKRFNDAKELSVAEMFDYHLLRLDEKALRELSQRLFGPRIEDDVLELIRQANQFQTKLSESPSHLKKQRGTRTWQFLCDKLGVLLKSYEKETRDREGAEKCGLG